MSYGDLEITSTLVISNKSTVVSRHREVKYTMSGCAVEHTCVLLCHDIIVEPKWQHLSTLVFFFGRNVQEVKNDPASLQVLEASL